MGCTMRIAFVCDSMIIGGVQRSLINLVNYLIKDKSIAIDLYLISKEGSMLNKLSPMVNIIEIPFKQSYQRCKTKVGAGVSYEIKSLPLKLRLFRLPGILWSVCFRKDYFSVIKPGIDVEKITNKEYDISICYHLHSPLCLYFASEILKHKKLYTWVHNDFAVTGFGLERYSDIFRKNARVFSVSEQLQAELLERAPYMSGKAFVLHNLIDIPEIQKTADEFVPIECQNAKVPLLISVGRLEEQKGFDVAISAAKYIKDKGLSYKWLIIGTGTQARNLQNLINENGLDKNVKLLGARENPYAYIKNAYIYIYSRLVMKDMALQLVRPGYCIGLL